MKHESTTESVDGSISPNSKKSDELRRAKRLEEIQHELSEGKNPQKLAKIDKITINYRAPQE